MFRHEVGLPPHAEPWLQCTDADKVAYEQEWAREHPQPETIEPEEAAES